MYRELILDALTRNTTMNDAEITALLASTADPISAYQDLMSLVSEEVVIMSEKVDAADRVIGGVYSLPTAKRAARRYK